MTIRAAALLYASLSVSVLAVPARSAEWRCRLDPAATRVDFTLQATLHRVEGTVPLKEGFVTFDPASSAASGRLVFDATGARTGNAKRDEKMHAEVLESARFGEIVLTPERVWVVVDASGRGSVTLAGKLAIHGSEHALTITAMVRREGERAFAEGDFTVPYVAWGMKDPSVFVMRVAKELKVHFTASGTLTQAVGP